MASDMILFLYRNNMNVFCSWAYRHDRQKHRSFFDLNDKYCVVRAGMSCRDRVTMEHVATEFKVSLSKNVIHLQCVFRYFFVFMYLFYFSSEPSYHKENLSKILVHETTGRQSMKCESIFL